MNGKATGLTRSGNIDGFRLGGFGLGGFCSSQPTSRMRRNRGSSGRRIAHSSGRGSQETARLTSNREDRKVVLRMPANIGHDHVKIDKRLKHKHSRRILPPWRRF